MGLGALFNPSAYGAENVSLLNRLFIDDEAFASSQANNQLFIDNANRQLAEGKLTRETYDTFMLSVDRANLPLALTKSEVTPETAFWGTLSDEAKAAFAPVSLPSLGSLGDSARNLATTTAKASLTVIVLLIAVVLFALWIATRRGVNISAA